MAAQYPTNLVTTTQLPDTRTDGTATLTNHAADHNQLADEVIAIEAELGVNASGSFATIAEAVGQQFIPVTVTFDIAAVAAGTTTTQNVGITPLTVGDICIYGGCTTGNPGPLMISTRPICTVTNQIVLNLRNTDTAGHSLAGQTHLFLVSHQS